MSDFDNKTLTAIRRGRKNFAAMASTYCLGVFNDNFFKQSAMLIAVAAGMMDRQGYAAVVFTLPYLLFASQSGWLSDRYSKRNVMIGSKALELAAMIFGAAGIYTGNWYLIFTMLFIMGFQSCIFSPAINGSIPELYPEIYVPTANAYIKVLTTAAIFGGIAASGIILEKGFPAIGISNGRLAVAVMIVSASVLGLIISLGSPPSNAQAPEKPFPKTGPLDTLKTISIIHKDKLLSITVLSNVFLWFTGSIITLSINPLGIQQFGLSQSNTSYLSVTLLAGIAVGGLIAGRLTRHRPWFKVLSPAAAGMALCLMLIGIVPLSGLETFFASLSVSPIYLIFFLIGLTGIFSGVFLIPLESFIQIRPAPTKKGEIISAVNFLIFGGIFLSGFLSNILNANLNPTTALSLTGIGATCISIWLYFSFNTQKKGQSFQSDENQSLGSEITASKTKNHSAFEEEE